jgi:hypothetical protein
MQDPDVPIEKSNLGIAGEFAVASELCRRNIYAQLTLGNQKRVDLLTMSRDRKLLAIEVKAKQTRTWANIKGLSAPDAFLVFVDFADRSAEKRPDFFVLSSGDWHSLVTGHIERYLQKHPHSSAYVDVDGCPVYPEELTAQNKPYRGCTVRLTQVESHREAWSKIVKACMRVADDSSSAMEDR